MNAKTLRLDLPPFALPLILGLGIVWRLSRYCLHFPIWGDEASLCVQFLDRGYRELAQPLAHAQVAPVLFLWAELVLFKIAGGSELALRLLPVLAGIAALLLFWRFASLAISPHVGALALAILAVSYYPVRHGCEVKPYAFDLFAACLLLALAAEWRASPGRSWPAITLLCAVPFSLAASYPAVFVAGGISLALLPGVLHRRDSREWALFSAYNLLLVVSFATLYHLINAAQFETNGGTLTRYWEDAFPPGTPWAFLTWLIRTHTGNLMAYPVGGRNDGSVVTCLLCLVGTWALLRERRWEVLLLLLTPFALTFAAAMLHRYPYGGSARIAQHLAPAICLLEAGGISVLLARVRSGRRRERLTMAICVGLALVAIGGIIHDFARPFKTRDDLRVRQIVSGLFQRAGDGDQITIAGKCTDAPINFQWYLRLRGARVQWNGAINAGSLRATGGDLWFIDFQEPPQPPQLVQARLPQGPTYRLAGLETAVLQLGPAEDPPARCSIQHWQRIAENR